MNNILEEISKLSPVEQSVIALKIQQSFEDYDEDFSPEELAIIEERLAEDERGEAVYISFEEVMKSFDPNFFTKNVIRN